MAEKTAFVLAVALFMSGAAATPADKLPDMCTGIYVSQEMSLEGAAPNTCFRL